MVLLGYKGSGRSSSGNTILGVERFRVKSTARCEKQQAVNAAAGRRRLTVVDTPGWWAEHALSETPEEIRQEIVRCASLCPPGPHALLLNVAAGFPHDANVYRYQCRSR